MRKLFYAETESERGEMRWEVHGSGECAEAAADEEWAVTVQPLADLLRDRVKEDVLVMPASSLSVCRCAVSR